MLFKENCVNKLSILNSECRLVRTPSRILIITTENWICSIIWYSTWGPQWAWARKVKISQDHQGLQCSAVQCTLCTEWSVKNCYYMDRFHCRCLSRPICRNRFSFSKILRFDWRICNVVCFSSASPCWSVPLRPLNLGSSASARKDFRMFWRTFASPR